VQGLIFLLAIIFYLLVDEPQRRAALWAKFKRDSDAGPIGLVDRKPARDRAGSTRG
jgi:hypothetical protein